MGRRERREREQKRQSYASKRSAEKRKQLLIAIGVMAVIGAIVAYAAVMFVSLPTTAPGGPENAGALGSAHAHTAILVEIFDDRFDFSVPSYQQKSSWIHFEGRDGSTIHKHATGVTMGYLFETLGVEIDDQCFVFPNGREFCTDEDYNLVYMINGEMVDDIQEYEPMEDDRILISYGATPETLESQLLRLENQIIVR